MFVLEEGSRGCCWCSMNSKWHVAHTAGQSEGGVAGVSLRLPLWDRQWGTRGRCFLFGKETNVGLRFRSFSSLSVDDSILHSIYVVND